MWVMLARDYKKEEPFMEHKGDISGSHVLIWIICFKTMIMVSSSGATNGFILLCHINSKTPKDLYTHLNVLNWQNYPLI